MNRYEIILGKEPPPYIEPKVEPKIVISAPVSNSEVSDNRFDWSIVETEGIGIFNPRAVIRSNRVMAFRES